MNRLNTNLLYVLATTSLFIGSCIGFDKHELSTYFYTMGSGLFLVKSMIIYFGTPVISKHKKHKYVDDKQYNIKPRINNKTMLDKTPLIGEPELSPLSKEYSPNIETTINNNLCESPLYIRGNPKEKDIDLNIQENDIDNTIQDNVILTINNNARYRTISDTLKYKTDELSPSDI